jgi:hypothetical protein
MKRARIGQPVFCKGEGWKLFEVTVLDATTTCVALTKLTPANKKFLQERAAMYSRYAYRLRSVLNNPSRAPRNRKGS